MGDNTIQKADKGCVLAVNLNAKTFPLGRAKTYHRSFWLHPFTKSSDLPRQFSLRVAVLTVLIVQRIEFI